MDSTLEVTHYEEMVNSPEEVGCFHFDAAWREPNLTAFDDWLNLLIICYLQSTI